MRDRQREKVRLTHNRAVVPGQVSIAPSVETHFGSVLTGATCTYNCSQEIMEALKGCACVRVHIDVCVCVGGVIVPITHTVLSTYRVY